MEFQDYKPEDFEKRTGNAKKENDLRKWLRSIPESERIDFIKRLWPLNFRFALSLLKSSKLSVEDMSLLYKSWLQLGQHNAAQGLIEELEPALGEERFWRIAASIKLSPEMEEFLNYHGHGKFDKYKNT